MRVLWASLAAILSASTYAIQEVKWSDGSVAKLSGKPSLLVFLKPGCPHNPAAVPILRILRNSLGGQVGVYPVIAESPALSASVLKELGLAGPAIAQPDRSLLKQAKASHSLDMVLLSRQGKPVQTWEGISRANAREINAALKELGVAKRIPLEKIPAGTLSGCGL